MPDEIKTQDIDKPLDKTYTVVFSDQAEGLVINLLVENDALNNSAKPFNLTFALMELAKQLVAAAQKK